MLTTNTDQKIQYGAVDNAAYRSKQVAKTDSTYFKNGDSFPVKGQKILVTLQPNNKVVEAFVYATDVIPLNNGTDLVFSVAFGNETEAWGGKLKYSRVRWVVEDINNIEVAEYKTLVEKCDQAINNLLNKTTPDIEDTIKSAENGLGSLSVQEQLESLEKLSETLLISDAFADQQAHMLCLRIRLAFVMRAYAFCAREAQSMQSALGEPEQFVEEFDQSLHEIYFVALIDGAESLYNGIDDERCIHELLKIRKAIPEVFRDDEETAQRLMNKSKVYSDESEISRRSVVTLRVDLPLDEATDVYRVIEVYGLTTLEELREYLVASFGWVGAEGDEFIVSDHGPVHIGPTPEDDSPLVSSLQDEQAVVFLKDVKDTFVWVYDIDDDRWLHEIQIVGTREETVKEEERDQYPKCIDGAGATPPENVGGVRGYKDFLHVTLTEKPSSRFPSKSVALEHASHNIGFSNSALSRCHGVFRRPKKIAVPPPHNMALLCSDHNICGDWGRHAFDLGVVNRALHELVQVIEE